MFYNFLFFNLNLYFRDLPVIAYGFLYLLLPWNWRQSRGPNFTLAASKNKQTFPAAETSLRDWFRFVDIVFIFFKQHLNLVYFL